MFVDNKWIKIGTNVLNLEHIAAIQPSSPGKYKIYSSTLEVLAVIVEF